MKPSPWLSCATCLVPEAALKAHCDWTPPETRPRLEDCPSVRPCLPRSLLWQRPAGESRSLPIGWSPAGLPRCLLFVATPSWSPALPELILGAASLPGAGPTGPRCPCVLAPALVRCSLERPGMCLLSLWVASGRASPVWKGSHADRGARPPARSLRFLS